MYYFVMTAIICLSLTILAGFILTWKILPLELLSTIGICYFHILHLESQVGWFSLLIFGFSYKLIPMFSLSHEFSMKWVKRAFVTYVCWFTHFDPIFLGKCTTCSENWKSTIILRLFIFHLGCERRKRGRINYKIVKSEQLYLELRTRLGNIFQVVRNQKPNIRF